jgi:hypothetical protein
VHFWAFKFVLKEHPCSLHHEGSRTAPQSRRCSIEQPLLIWFASFARRLAVPAPSSHARSIRQSLRGRQVKGVAVDRPHRYWSFLLVAAFVVVSASAQEAADFFQQNCASCHTITGGRLTGPDLKALKNGATGHGSRSSFSILPP